MEGSIMKKLLAAGALVMTVAVAAAVLVLPALAHGSAPQTPKHTTVHITKPNPFNQEHRHGAEGGSGHSSDFSFSCASNGAVKGNQVIAVTEAVKNDVDSGQGGNYWAYDTTNRSIAIWNVGPDQYCAVLNYHDSSFKAIAGQESPGTSGTLTSNEYGTFAGSALFTITGQLDVSDPTVWPTSGKVNHGVAVNYQCDVSGNCPGYVSFLDKYFASGYSDNEPQWGWTYYGKVKTNHGTKSAGVWVNAYTGNSGDILAS